MNDVMALALQSLQGDAMRMDRVSGNLANATTPGYKRELSVQRAGAAAGMRFADLVEQQAHVAPGGLDPTTGEVMRDLRVGTLKSTGQPFDLAISGRGYFEVATPAGPAYTRHGQFQLDARGRVVTMQGHALMGSGGEIVVTAAPTIDPNGAMHVDGQVVGKVRIVDFDNAQSLERAAGGLYAASSPANPVDENATQVRQGYLENANVEPMREMVELIRTMRHFESMHRVVQIYDDMLGTGIRKLGDV